MLNAVVHLNNILYCLTNFFLNSVSVSIKRLAHFKLKYNETFVGARRASPKVIDGVETWSLTGAPGVAQEAIGEHLSFSPLCFNLTKHKVEERKKQ